MHPSMNAHCGGSYSLFGLILLLVLGFFLMQSIVCILYHPYAVYPVSPTLLYFKTLNLEC